MKKPIATLLTLLMLSACFSGLALAPQPPFAFRLAPKPTPPRPEYMPTKTLTMLASAYYGPEKGQPRYLHGTYHKEVRVNGTGEFTVLGEKPNVGIVAADPSFLRPGSKLLIKDPFDGKEKIYTVGDTGEKMIGKRLDFFMGHGMRGLKAAEKFGKREVVVKLLSSEVA